MPPAGFEPAIPANDRQQTHSLDGAANEFGAEPSNCLFIASYGALDKDSIHTYFLTIHFSNTEWHKKTGTFEKPNKNWRNPKKKKYIYILTEIEPLQLAF